MPATCVIGAQWGDEGKGKVVDLLGAYANRIVRFQGGNNAGHTVVIDKEYALHALPVGVLRGIRSLIASEVVLDPRQLVKEIKNFDWDINLGIDPRTAIIMPWHNHMDIAMEEARKKDIEKKEIGTTKKGIGPCYADDAYRIGIRFNELVGDRKILEDRINEVYILHKKILKYAYDYDINKLPNVNEVIEEYVSLGKDLKKYLVDVSKEIYEALKKNKNVLFEGAQGTLLDLKWGNYPNVSSSHPMAGAVCTSVGIAPKHIKDMRVVGIIKAYLTKVGSGPVVTCLDKGLWPVDESKSEPEGNYIRKKGVEKGTTTGRLRRVGWMDIPALKYTHRLNGFSELALMKLDCLAGLDKIKLAVAYKYKHNGQIIEDYPSWDIKFLEDCEPVYEEFDGFKKNIRRVRKYSQLPKNAKKYVERIEDLMGVPITIVSTGPGRGENIYRGFEKV